MPISSPFADDADMLFGLREVAKHCSSAPHAQGLRDAADDLAAGLRDLAADPTAARMRRANNAWMRALRALTAAPPMGGHDERGGALREGARLAA